jgi:hypothetical protein
MIGMGTAADQARNWFACIVCGVMKARRASAAFEAPGSVFS